MANPNPKAKAGTKKTQVAQFKKTEILQSVGGLSLAGVAESLAKTQVAVQEKLADVSSQMSVAIQQLGTVNEAIVAKQEELKTLHEIEATALTLDDLNGTIQETRETWTAEQKRQAQADAERAAELAKGRKREEDEYAYRTNQERRKLRDDFDAQIAAARKSDNDRKEALEKGWAAREGELKARENELADLRAAVAAYPAAMKRDTDAAVAVATNSLKKNLENEHLLRAKDAETSLKIAQNDKAARDQEIARLQVTITDLHKQLESAHRAAQNVAEKALESASGRAVVDAPQQSQTRTESAQPAGGRR